MSVTVGEIDLNAYVDPPPFAVSRATHWPPPPDTPWLTDRPATVDHIDSEPLSKSSWNRTPADGVVTVAVLLSTDELRRGVARPDRVAVRCPAAHGEVAVAELIRRRRDASGLPALR